MDDHAGKRLVTWAVMVSLAALWRAVGVHPAAVIGHSLGEVDAACVAGTLSLAEGARVATIRGQLTEQLRGQVGLVAVGLPADVVRERLHQWDGKLLIGAINSPTSVAVSGDHDALTELQQAWAGHTRLREITEAGYPSHSPAMEQLRQPLADRLGTVAFEPGTVAWYSTVTGEPVDPATLTGEYWYDNLRQPVDFHGAITALCRDGYTDFIEISAHPVLLADVRDTAEDAGVTPLAVGTLRSGEGGPRSFLTSAAQWHTGGGQLDWTTLLPGATRVDLPTYPFQHESYWLDGRTARTATAAIQPAPRVQALVRHACATVLGTSLERVEMGVAFKDLGFDSAMLTELITRLAATGLSLTSNTLFDYPTPTRLVDHLTGQTPRTTTTPATTGADDPIAIVSMSVRLPGGVDSPESLWSLLAEGTDAIADMPRDRGWDSQIPGGGFLYDAGLFDPEFFGISPREALAMDPQQRLLLETSWEAVERARIDPTALRGTATGVFFGAMGQDYGTGLTGTSASIISGRVAYVLGTQGPAVTVDTACSSSLVAIHMAAQALRSGECTMALAGGATVMVSPGIFTEFARQGGLSADGRCKAFADAADGTGWAEGVGVLILQRLSDAVRERRDIMAVIKGSAVNSDGASNGLTAPSGIAQQQVIRQALANAGLAPAHVDAEEAHDTGTTLGDPIEAQALLATYGQNRPTERPLLLGSLKSNIGHTQAAAGVAGVAKMILAMRQGPLPRTLHIDQPTTKVDWAAGAVRLLTEPAPWPQTDRPRRAGISSFGVSGTNAHLILEQAPPSAPDPATDTPPPVVPLVVTARSPQGLAAQAGRLASFLHDQDTPLAGTAAALITTRAQWDHRAVILAGDRDEAITALHSLAAGAPGPQVIHGTAGSLTGRGKTVMAFPGQGAQWPGMGAELWDTNQVFAERMAACEQALAPWVDWSLSDVIHQADGAPALDRADVVQPASFAVMISLAALWQAHGLRIDAVLGHSQGEIAAACIAGALTLPDAARIIAARSQAIAARLSGHGAMLSVATTETDARHVLQPLGDKIEIAAINSPAALVLAGPAHALDQAQAAFEARGTRTRTLPVDYASHTSQVDTLQDTLTGTLGHIRTTPPAIPWLSTVTQDWVTGPVDPGYWYDNLRQPVRFADAIAELSNQGYGVFIESSPHPVLVTAIEETLQTSAPAVVGTLRRDQGSHAQFLRSMADLYVRGIPVNWAQLIPASRHPVPLPTTAFQHKHFWLKPTTPTDATGLGLASAQHPLLGAVVETPQSDEVVLTGRVGLPLQPWLANHAVGGQVLVPGTALVELAIHAGDHTGCPMLDELVIETPMLLPVSTILRLQVIVAEQDETGRRPLAIYSRPETGDPAWTRHATGYLSDNQAAEGPPVLTSWPPADAHPLRLEDFYDTLADRGYHYGPVFQGVQAAWQGGNETFAEVALPEGTDTTGFPL